jgi:quercetin dioxygenase-like cupin family protein
MPSLNRPLTGPMLTFDLESQLAELRKDEAYRRSGRAGRTLAKSGRLRLTLVAMAAGNEIGTHQADSPMALHVLQGHLRFRADGEDHEMRSGEVLFFGPGDAHDIRAEEESALLITISALGDDYLMEKPTESESPQG